MLGIRQAIPTRWRFANQCPQLGTPKTHAPLVPKTQAGLTHHSPIPGVQVPVQTWTPSPHFLSSGLSVVQGPPPSPPPISRSEKSRIRDKRATSLPSAHTQVCARDNKICDLPRWLMQRSVFNRSDRESSVTKSCPVSMATQPLTPTNTQTISLPDHQFTSPNIYIFQVIVI